MYINCCLNDNIGIIIVYVWLWINALCILVQCSLQHQDASTTLPFCILFYNMSVNASTIYNTICNILLSEDQSYLCFDKFTVVCLFQAKQICSTCFLHDFFNLFHRTYIWYVWLKIQILIIIHASIFLLISGTYNRQKSNHTNTWKISGYHFQKLLHVINMFMISNCLQSYHV